MKRIMILAVGVSWALAADAVIYSTNWTVNASIPDNNLSGWASSRTVNTMPAGTLNGVAVDIALTSGWTGDLYAYLVHEAGFAVLLDRIGTPGLTYGHGAGNLNVTLADNGFNSQVITANIHGAGANASGYFNPDDDNAGFALTSASGSLGSFAGTNPNGTWTLFVADLSGGGLTTVENWGLQMDIVAVPEVETWVAAALAGMFGAFWLNRQICGGMKRE